MNSFQNLSMDLAGEVIYKLISIYSPGGHFVQLLYIWENECCMFVQMVILTRVYELTVHSALRQLVDLSG